MNDEERESRPQRGRGRGYGGRTSRWHVNPKSNVDTQPNQSPSKQDNQKQTQNQTSSSPPPAPQQQQQQHPKRQDDRHQRNQRSNYRRTQGGKLPIMCMYFISESGCPQENCRYAHGDGELERIRNSRGRRNSDNENYGEEERDYYRGPPKPYRQGRRNDFRRDDRNRNQRNPPQVREEIKGRDDDEVPERTPALPPDSISKASLQRIAQMVNCRHIQKGCQFLSSKADLPAHMEKCPFERCKDYLANGQIDPIIKYFKKQIRQRDILIADLRSQVANNFKEEEETFGLEEEHINLFKELVFSGAGALQITSTFSSRYPNCQWSVFFHHVSESDLSYVYDGYLQWVYKSRRYILIKLNEDE